MAGGPSHLETFDYKPKLAEMHGQPMPESFTKGQPIAQLQGQKLNCFGPQHRVQASSAKSGQEICELFPHIGAIADEICIIRSMQTEAINHDPAHTFMNTGTTDLRPAGMGSWVIYGLGSESEDLPGFVVLDLDRARRPDAADRRRGSGTAASCPAGSRACSSSSQGRPGALPRATRRASTAERQRDVIDAVNAAEPHARRGRRRPGDRHAHRQYEMAFRMQASVPELMDISQRAASTCSSCTARKGGDGSFASNCLLARRLAERGVRFIQLYHRDWDHHGGIEERHAGQRPRRSTRPSAALITDLKQRGMLDDTLVVWGGEFGRTPMAQGDGRDHHIKGFSMWLAGGGIKRRHHLRRDRRARLQRRRGHRPRPRPARHDAAPAGHRPRAADLPLPGPRLPPDRRGRQRGQADPGMMPCDNARPRKAEVVMQLPVKKVAAE